MDDGIGKTEIEMLERIVEMAGDRFLTAFRCLGRIQIEKAAQAYTEAAKSLRLLRQENKMSDDKNLWCEPFMEPELIWYGWQVWDYNFTHGYWN